ncbi:MAG TPA: cytochrome P460 family protein [Acidobacteriaceae bacterium]
MTKQIICTATLFLLTLLPGAQSASAPMSDAPAYAADGSLVAPTHYREWIYLTTGIDMSYDAPTAPPDHHIFYNVFVNPTAYHSFLATGTWPDKTVMVLEVRGADSPISINKRGHTQSAEVMGLETHVKDRGKWSFFDDNGKLIPRSATCYTCHEAHAAVDTTFVQFYPTLLPLAKEKKTLSPEYLKEVAPPAQVAPGAAK